MYRVLVPAILLGVLILVGPPLAARYVDWLWFGELGQRGVFWKLLALRWGLGAAFAAAMAVFFAANLVVARRACGLALPPRGGPEWRELASMVLQRSFAPLLALATIALALLTAGVGAAQWEAWTLFSNRQEFGSTDPVFGRDLGFYVFQLPFLRFLVGWLFAATVLTAAATAGLYYVDAAIGMRGTRLHVSQAARTHLSLLLAATLAVKAWDYWLQRYGLLLNPGGVMFGAGYTDLHARLPALNILTVTAGLAAAGFVVNARLRALWLPVACLGVTAATGLAVGGLYPALMQRFAVAPAEQSRERTYIEYHLDATRRAYGLDRIRTVDYQPGRPLGPADLTQEAPTLENIRLWDYRILGQTYQRLQGLRQYYHVATVDIDRYTLGGKYRQVMLAAREMVTERLPQRRWVNEKLQYTHGYGLVMSGVNEADPSGRPVWLARDLPLSMPRDLPLERPEIYYGRQTRDWVIAPSHTAEFDYPTEAASASSSYKGEGGIPLSGPLRLFFAVMLGDWNILISDQVRPDSRILLRRTTAERVSAVAPFLMLDRDPYLVVVDGRLVWVQDAYTTASTYPYSEPTAFADVGMMNAALLDASAEGPARRWGSFNYLRNSVKATVDAYTGAVTLYAFDEADPVLRAYRAAFPSLFRPASALPDSLTRHLRLPEDQFRLQAHKLLRFHVREPDVFYGRSDVWDVPAERVGEDRGGARQMEPYYVVMRLPGEEREEFSLILPFRTRAGTTMTAWLAGRCDGDRYGELILYRFPANTQVDAPDQVDNAIATDVVVSKEVTLLGQLNSQVRYGNLLVLPVGTSILYVKPLYLEATQQTRAGGIPELKRVILAEKRGEELRVVMQPTMREALAALVGGAPVPARPDAALPPPSAGRPASVGGLASEAAAAFEAADAALRSGNWTEYGRQIERARAAVRRLQEAAGR